ncbi:serine hydrolase [Streptomyces sp. NPDC001852]|uniref:serine hydrolase n=1 Tax=Streptomyces sp. NPDC001852 TaxID=3364619 RepID=UPI0036AA5ABB
MPSHPSPATARTRAGALPVSVAALVSLGALHPAPAASSPAPPRMPRPPCSTWTEPAAPRWCTGRDGAYDTAGIVKVDILAALLLRAQDAGHGLTAEERGRAEPMIERSDNSSADALWRRIGRASGPAAANKRLGLTSTTGGPGVKWGPTRTTARDRIRLLRTVCDDDTAAKPGSTAKSAALNAQSRTCIRTLMGQVVPEQTWGVPAADGSGSPRALKNGWLQRNTSGLWNVDSVGQVTVKGHHCLMAVLSNGSASMSDGISLVERTARRAVA